MKWDWTHSISWVWNKFMHLSREDKFRTVFHSCSDRCPSIRWCWEVQLVQGSNRQHSPRCSNDLLGLLGTCEFSHHSQTIATPPSVLMFLTLTHIFVFMGKTKNYFKETNEVNEKNCFRIGMWCNSSETCFSDEEVSLRAQCQYEMFSKYNIRGAADK